ncbi:BTB/POZ domain-containing protein 6-B-like [Morone saxatilis]|nr:BTB/POZ domain-containing protein 6-B-like [Morone saxatilis]
MAAELFSTSLPHSNEVEVKKSFIQPSEPEPTASNYNDGDDNGVGVQPNINNNEREERDGWQEAQPTLRERNALMFNNEQMADVHFIVGPPGDTQRIPAHKYVLAVGSSVFGAMFYGDLAEGQSEIHIPDVEPAAFLILLK